MFSVLSYQPLDKANSCWPVCSSDHQQHLHLLHIHMASKRLVIPLRDTITKYYNHCSSTGARGGAKPRRSACGGVDYLGAIFVFNGAPRVWAEKYTFWAQNTGETATRRAPYIIGHSMESSVELHGAHMELHGGSWSSMEAHGAPWRSMEAPLPPWRLRVGLHGPPWTFMVVSMEVRGGLHGAP